MYRLIIVLNILFLLIATPQSFAVVDKKESLRLAQFNPLLKKPDETETEQKETEEDREEETLEENESSGGDNEFLPEDEPLPPENELDEEIPIEEDFPVEEPLPAEEEIDELTPKKITIDMVIYVDYQFFDSPDAFKVKYHLNMGGTVNLGTAAIKGSAEIATAVTGYLAKWPGGQCMLDISIAKVPYEINYIRYAGEADININFNKEITETWSSTCTFLGGSSKPFKTVGPPEKWIEDALNKTSPPLNALVAPVENRQSTSTTFTVPEYTVIEENLGSAKVKGTGVITIQPVNKERPRSK